MIFIGLKSIDLKLDHFAKIIIDTIIQSTKIGQKLLVYYQKIQKLTKEDAIKKLDEITPLANAIKKMKNIDKQTPVSELSSPPTITAVNRAPEEKKIANVPSAIPNTPAQSISQLAPEAVTAPVGGGGAKGVSR